MENQAKEAGRPGVPAELIQTVWDLDDQGEKPADIIRATGLSQTKVYELLRAKRLAKGGAAA